MAVRLLIRDIIYFVFTKKQTNFGAAKNANNFYKQLLV
jgi:hypothetical protein